VKTLQFYQSSQFKFAIIGKGFRDTLGLRLFPIPQRDLTIGVWLHQEYSTTTKTLGERKGNKLVLWFLLKYKTSVSKDV